MRLVYVLSCLLMVTLALLWGSWFGYWKRRVAFLISGAIILLGGILLLLSVLPQNNFYGTTITKKVAVKEKLVALTFDDGPYKPYTQQLVKLLKAQQVPATFFMVASSAQKYPELVQQMVAEGHEIGLHAYKHRDLLWQPQAEVVDNVVRGKAVLESLSGQEIVLMRPPHGFRDWFVMDLLQKNKLTAINWSVITHDWKNPGVDVIVNKVMQNVEPGAIILMHDGDSPKYRDSREQTLESTEIIINKLRQNGYKFVTVGQLLQS